MKVLDPGRQDHEVLIQVATAAFGQIWVRPELVVRSLT